MTIRRVRSTDGNNADDGSTWALARAGISSAGWSPSAGDEVWLSQSHDENLAAAFTFNSNGSDASPTRCICVNDAADPPTDIAYTAVISTTGNFGINLNGKCYYAGIIFKCGLTGTSTATITTSNNSVWESCEFWIASTGSSAKFTMNSGYSQEYHACGWKFADANQSITLVGGRYHFNSMYIVSGSVAPERLFVIAGVAVDLLIENSDFSNLDTDLVIFGQTAAASRVRLRDSKLPAAWAGSLYVGNGGGTNGWDLNSPGRVEMWNCSAGDTNYELWIEDFYGTIRDETIHVMTGGASADGIGIAWKMTSLSNANYLCSGLVSPELVKRVGVTGTYDLEIEFLSDSATDLTNEDISYEIAWLADPASPMGTYTWGTKDPRVSTLAATALDASAATWTTTALTNPNAQKMLISGISIEQAGYIIVRIRLLKASFTVFVNPDITVTAA